ncbi:MULTISPECIES: MFS transporter [Methylomonas]|uniref:MFS transporter n=1 Tax=Methylomonas koyamae TaxID=702114 RepID=A0A177NKM5_9GAMM|nr:MFS transporter [Methylomonas koyamae]OAI18412.1 MFS transporter [Methylomonas koyamae]
MPVPYWRLSSFYFFYFATLGSFLPFWSLYLRQVGFAADQIGELTALMVATKIVAPNCWGWLADKTGRNLGLIRLTSLLAVVSFAAFAYRSDFRWYAAVTILFSFFWNATLPQFEAATLFHLKAEPQRYSRIRLWGSIGFITAVLGIGRFVDAFSIAYLPLIIAGLMILNWLTALITPEAAPRHASRSGDAGLWRVLRRPEVLAFLLVYLLLQAAHGPYYVFYSVYLQQHGYSASATGLLWASGVAAEVLIFVAMRPLLKWMGPRGLLLASIVLSVVRWMLIADAVDSLALTVVAQLLHAATFGVAHVVAMQLLFQYFGETHQAKGQALYSSVSFGVGGMLGSLYSGYFWALLGGRLVYIIAALICCLALLAAYLGVARESRPRIG